MNPITLMLSSERPKVSLATRRPILAPGEIEQTLAASTEPYRTLFTVAALTGARVSELCGLTCADVRLDDLDDAEITFAWQVDRKGNLRPTKTDGSARTVPIPRELALVLARHKLAAPDVTREAFVFATCTGRALSQRNVARALRKAQQRATDEHGQPTFPVLQEQAEVPAGVVPSMHSFPAYGRVTRPARRRERGRGRVPPWPPRCHGHPCRLHPRDRGRPPPAHAALTHDRRVRRRSPCRPPERGR
jgi:integrase